MSSLRLGDIIDDYCVKCRRLTNHAIVSLVDGAASKVRCRTCYHDHDYRHEQAPPSKKDLKKAELFNQVLAGTAAAGDSAGAPVAADGAVSAPDGTAATGVADAVAPVVVPVDGTPVEPAIASDGNADEPAMAAADSTEPAEPVGAKKRARKSAK